MASTRQCLCLVLLLVAVAAPAVVSGRPSSDVPMSVRHEQWMARHGRVYKDATEKERRLKIFKANAEYVESVNRAGDRTYTLGLNQFADRTAEELRLPPLELRPRPPANTSTFTATPLDDVPDRVNWVTRGAVTAVKDQEQCGCCWAFSAVAAVEGITQIKTGQPVISLSEQEVLDCTGSGDSCKGGRMDDAFSFIVRNGGLATESSYPYQGVQGVCKAKASTSAAAISGHVDVRRNDGASLMAAVAMQPVSVAIKAGSRDFQFYQSGIFSGQCGDKLDHAVTVVGYDVAEDGTKYWLLKNQWGQQWGEGGYMRLKRGIMDPEGTCGVAMDPSYPTA